MHNVVYTCKHLAPKPDPFFATVEPAQFVGYYVKLAFYPTEKDTCAAEHMWVRVQGVNADDTLFGVLDNTPLCVTHVKRGDRIDFNREDIEALLRGKEVKR